MTSPNTQAPAVPQPLHVKTPHGVSEKPSRESISSQTPTLADEKKGNTTSHEVPARASDVSSPSSNRLNPFDTDVEACITPSSTKCELRKSRGGDCEVWPGRDHWKQRAKAAKKKRAFGCLSQLSRRNRIIVKILIVVLIVGIAVAVGLGISKPLGAGIWHSKDYQ